MYLAVAVGAALGAMARHGCSELSVAKKIAPFHIVGVNMVGSCVLGAIAATPNLSPTNRALLGTGFCGALTTFSTFSVGETPIRP